jgi:Family of unknown function (DUF6675)
VNVIGRLGPPRWSVVIPLALLATILCGAVLSPEPQPQPPCGSETFPPYPDLDKPPTAKFWDRSDLGRDWIPPACTGWTKQGFATLVVTVGRFSSSSGADGMRRRIGAISELTGVHYWSTTQKQWQTLIVDAYAETGPPADQRRRDFSPDEIAEGKDLYFQQADNLSGKAIYRMRILGVSPDRLVFDTENITTMRYWLIPLFHPGDIQAIYFLERQSQDVWRYYSIARTGKNANTLTSGHQASSVNRAVAFYRYFAGIPTDNEPPAAR